MPNFNTGSVQIKAKMLTAMLDPLTDHFLISAKEMWRHEHFIYSPLRYKSPGLIYNQYKADAERSVLVTMDITLRAQEGKIHPDTLSAMYCSERDAWDLFKSTDEKFVSQLLGDEPIDHELDYYPIETVDDFKRLYQEAVYNEASLRAHLHDLYQWNKVWLEHFSDYLEKDDALFQKVEQSIRDTCTIVVNYPSLKKALQPLISIKAKEFKLDYEPLMGTGSDQNAVGAKKDHNLIDMSPILAATTDKEKKGIPASSADKTLFLRTTFQEILRRVEKEKNKKNYGPSTQKAIHQLYEELTSVKWFLANDLGVEQRDVIQFFRNAVKTARPQLEKHREWKTIFAMIGNFLLSVATLGIGPCVNRYVTGDWCFFKPKTHLTEQLDEVENKLDALETNNPVQS